MIEWNRLCNKLTDWMWKDQPTRLSETVANWAAEIQTPKKKGTSPMHERLNQQGSRNPTKMGQLLVIRVKWKEINLECLHGKWCVWVARSGCWIWGYEGMNHTSTCAWNTCGTFVQNLPKMPIRQIKVMEHPPPSQSYPHKPLVRNIMKKTGFLVKFGYAWILLRFS